MAGPRNQPASGADRPQQQPKPQSNLVRLTGLWKKKNAKGTYLTGRLGAAVVFIFPHVPNPERKGDSKPSEPDYVLYVAPDRPPSEKSREPGEDDL